MYDNVNDETVKAVLQERGKIYGDAVDTHARIAQVWSGVIGTEVTALQVALCMVGLKLIRAECAPEHEDSYVDIGGYTEIVKKIAGV